MDNTGGYSPKDLHFNEEARAKLIRGIEKISKFTEPGYDKIEQENTETQNYIPKENQWRPDPLVMMVGSVFENWGTRFRIFEIPNLEFPLQTNYRF